MVASFFLEVPGENVSLPFVRSSRHPCFVAYDSAAELCLENQEASQVPSVK